MWRNQFRSAQFCKKCNEFKDHNDHDTSDKHLKNVMLYEFCVKRGRHYETEKGVSVYCNAKSSYGSLINSVNARIKLSVRPNEVVRFDFVVSNDSIYDYLFLNFVKVVHSRLDFKMNDHGFFDGSTPQCIGPKLRLGKPVHVVFSSSHIGQYECPIMFSFKKLLTEETIYLLRDIVVLVEDTQFNVDVIDYPYTSKPLTADTLYKTSCREKMVSKSFKVPTDRQKIFKKNFELGNDSSSKEKALATQIEGVFDIGPTQENYLDLFRNLLWFEETTESNQLKNYNMTRVNLWRVGEYYLLLVPGLAEKRPSLMPGDMVYVKPSYINSAMFEGVIAEVLLEAIYIRGFHDEFEDNYYQEGLHYDVSFSSSRLSHERMQRVLHSSQGTEIFTRIFPMVSTNIRNMAKKFTINRYFNPAIKDNEEQRIAVEHIIAGSSGNAPYLVHGPPGTGKTVTVVESILQIVIRDYKNRVLVCTDSNMAADHVAVQLIKYAPNFNENFLLRANARMRTWDTMPYVLAPYSNGESQFKWYKVLMNKFKTHRIVVTTIAHSAQYASVRRKYNMKRHITHLFIDEAAQALEPLTLLPVCGLLIPTGTLVLAGDPMQLGPVVLSNLAKRAGLGVSLMERLQKTCELYSDERSDPNYITTLRNNFRSDPDIIELPNKLFYKNQLRACANPDPLTTLNILTGAYDCRGIVFHGVLSSEKKIASSPSFFNPLEQMMIHRYVLALVNRHKVPFEDIGIITPYNRQMQMIRCWLSIKGYDKIEVGTVEAFQGKEKRFILISTVRANADLLNHDAKFKLGFLVDDKRFNVAITRAKAKCVIIGNPLCLNLDAKWRIYIQRCRELGTYYGFDYEKTNNEAVYGELTNGIGRLLMHPSRNRQVPRE